GRATLMLDAGPAADLEAVEEAVTVIRTLQDTAGARVSSAGAHHWLAGAEPGPAVDREVPLWVHGSEAAVAALAGRVADGWSADLAGIGVEGLAERTAVLDRAAVDAGRDVREVRR